MKKASVQAEHLSISMSSWETLNGHMELQDKREQTFEELQHIDLRRKTLLALARALSPMMTAMRWDLVHKTVLPRLLRRKLTYIVFATWIITATCARLEVTESDIEEKQFEGAGTMVTFMIMFYVGYCYTRHNELFDNVRVMMRSIVTCCALARANFGDEAEVRTLRRYLNLLHVAAYTGLSPTYTVKNFFDPMCEKHGLFGDAPRVLAKQREQEQVAIRALDIDREGGRAWQMFMVWALEVVKRQAAAGHLSPPVHAQFNAQIAQIADSANGLFVCSYQVLPFIYTHLVSFSCTVFLVASAFLKGIHFTPSQSYTFGVVVPAGNIILTTITIFGLLEVGNTIMDPFGSDPEDYAILHFVEHVASASLDCVTVPSCPAGPPPPPRPTLESTPSDEALARPRTRKNVVSNVTRERPGRAFSGNGPAIGKVPTEAHGGAAVMGAVNGKVPIPAPVAHSPAPVARAPDDSQQGEHLGA